MAANKTLLDELRSRSNVDCDTLDYGVAEALGPFVDCTSNQAIAYGELQKPSNASLVTESIEVAKSLHKEYAAEVSLEELATEVIMVKLSSRVVKHLTGFAHVQTNPYNAYSVPKTIANAKRIISLFSKISPSFPSSRICIKIPSTYEGLLACKHLESPCSSNDQKIHTLATTLFTLPQAALAATAKCTYIAPYINALRVHFDPVYTDPDKGFEIARASQRYYKRIGAGTQVLPASLTSVQEVMKLAGADHITVSPVLLAELAVKEAGSVDSSWFAGEGGGEGDEEEEEEEEEEERKAVAQVEYLGKLIEDEAAYRMAFTRSKGGADENKLTDAINIFADMQDKMEEFVRKQL